MNNIACNITESMPVLLELHGYRLDTDDQNVCLYSAAQTVI
jgi:hypothetical protein